MQKHDKLPSRREFLDRTASAITAGGILTLPILNPASSVAAKQAPRQKISLGVVADVHQDIIHDGYARMRAFIDDMQQQKPNFLIQLGDFSLPRSQNQPFLDTWNQFEGAKYHVLGNHDMRDFGFTKEQTMEWWEMPQRYYSFDVGGWHFVVLDGNDQNPGEWSGYVRFIAEDQQKWLAEDLATTDSPTMVFSHQTLESDDGVANSGEVRDVLEQANRDAGWSKVYACLCGHHHSDRHQQITDINYLRINSMSYKWVGSEYQHLRFPAHIEHANPSLRNTIPYRDPLYTTLTLDPVSNTLSIAGRRTQFIPPTPEELKIARANSMSARISAREIHL